MPELPEAETIARVLRAELTGQLLPGHGPLRDVERHGKRLLLCFDAATLEVKLGMTGTLRLNTEAGVHTRAVLQFERTPLLYNDIRKFGRLQWLTEHPTPGPDALSISIACLARKLAPRKRAIKPLLLDQTFLAGLGNIYVDECLFASRTHPLTPAAAVDAKKLHLAVRKILHAAIESGGSTISDFYDPFGRPGRFQEQHAVYGRAGKLCPRCGATIARAVVAQRGTHYCPQCQPPFQPRARPQPE